MERLFWLIALTGVLAITFFFFIRLIALKQKYLSERGGWREEAERWKEIALTDDLTELPNRRAFEDKLDELKIEKNKGAVVHFMMIDIDDFKNINDTYGHPVGDRALRDAALVLKEVFSEKGYFIYRYGGDEFSVIAVGRSGEEISKKVALLLDTVFSEKNYRFTAGFSPVNWQLASPLEEALRQADANFYRKKEEKEVGR
jgi:diguanylate cyclase (GGDEF)-like protein